MERKKRVCVSCGKEYRYCPNCAEDSNKPTWMFAWDNIECKTVFNIVTKYCTKDISKSEARTLLDDVLTHTIKFNNQIEEKLAEIYKEEIPVKTRGKRKSVVIEEENNIVTDD